MIGKLITADFLKIKRKGLWFLTFLGPFGVVALQMVNYGFRKDYLLEQSENDWNFYLLNINAFTSLALVLGIAILTSFMASIENETNAWKQMITLPVSKMNVYLSKFTVLASLLFISSCLLMVFTFGYGLFLNFEEQVPYFALFQFSFYPYLASLPVLALQLWIATVSQNQAVPITTGVLSVLLTYNAPALPNWAIWKWPDLMSEGKDFMLFVMLGIGAGALIYLIGMLDFTRRDVS